MPAPKPCGTEAAYRRHLRHHEPACDACLAAHAEEASRYRGTTPRGALVDARPARTRVLRLVGAGVPYRRIVAESGVSYGALSRLVRGEPARAVAHSKRVHTSTAEALLQLDLAELLPPRATGRVS